MEWSFHCVADLQIRNRYGATSVISFYLKQVNYLVSCVLNHKQSGITKPSSVFTSLKNNIL